MIKTTSVSGRTALSLGLILLVLVGAITPARVYAETPAATSPSATAVALTEDEQEALNKGDISTGQYVVGGLVATFLFPFGVGQAVQGRYSDTGWIFTVGELASITTLVVGVASSSCRTTIASSTSLVGTTSCDTSPLLWVGLGGLVGFRIWEVIDA